MDIAAMSMALSQSQVKQQASLSVMKQAMSIAETNTAGLLQMLNVSNENTPHPYLGTNIDLKG